MLGDPLSALSQFVTHSLHIRRLSSQEQPARPGAECIRVFFEFLRRVVIRINADRNKENVTPDDVTQLFFQLRKACGNNGANVPARGINETQDYDLAFQHIVIEK